MTKQFRDFESAREFVRKLNLKSQQEWKDYYKSGKRPDDIPSNPNGTYKNEWISMGDWIGTEVCDKSVCNGFDRSTPVG